MIPYRKFILPFVLLVALLPFSACSREPEREPTPPKYGVFFIEGSEFIEIPVSQGQPDLRDSFVTAPNSQPLIALWSPDINLNYLSFTGIDLDGEGTEYIAKGRVDVDASPAEENVLEVRPKESLEVGLHCFIQGDPMGLPHLILHWCFMVR